MEFEPMKKKDVAFRKMDRVIFAYFYLVTRMMWAGVRIFSWPNCQKTAHAYTQSLPGWICATEQCAAAAMCCTGSAPDQRARTAWTAPVIASLT